MSTALIISYISAAISVGSAVYSILNAPDSPEDVGSKVQKRGTNAPRKIVYGEAIVDSVNVYNNVQDDSKDWMINVFSLGVGEVTSIRQVYADDLELLKLENFTYDPSADTTFKYERDNADFSVHFVKQNIEMQFRRGASTETAMPLATSRSDGEWTTSHRGDRVAQVAIAVQRSTREETPILNSSYQLTAMVQGMAIHDPRYHTGTVGTPSAEKDYEHAGGGPVPNDSLQCGRNPALCLLDFLTDDYYGMAIPADYLNIQSFMDSANWCDTNKLHIDGAVDTSDSFGECLKQITSAMQGVIVIEGGLVTLKFEDVETPFATVFDEDTVIKFGATTGATKENYYNVVEVDYKNAQANEKGDVYQIPADTSDITTGDGVKSRVEIDGFLKTYGIHMPMTIDNRTAVGSGLELETNIFGYAYAFDRGDYEVGRGVKFFANRAYLKSRYQQGIAITIDLSIHGIKVFDVIKVSNVALGWTERLFRVMNIGKSVDNDLFNIAEVNLVEYESSVYTGTRDGSTGTRADRVAKILSDVTALSFVTENYTISGYGKLSWNDTVNTAGLITYEVQYKLTSESVFEHIATVASTSALTPNLKLNDYDFRVRAVMLGWTPSDWVTITSQAVVQTIGMPTVTGGSAIATSPDFIFRWDDMSDTTVINPPSASNPNALGTDGTVKDYIKNYKIEIYHGAVLKRTFFTLSPEIVYPLADNTTDGLSRDVTAKVSILTKDGTESATQLSIVANNPQISTPTGFSGTVRDGHAVLFWDQVTDQDYRASELHISTTTSFTPNAGTKLVILSGTEYSWQFPDGDSDTRYFKVVHYDVFGVDSIQYSSQFAAVYSNVLQDALDATQSELDDVLPITETKLSDDAVTAPKIAANAVIAGKISVGNLGAITAVIGDLVGGTITGSVIKTATSGKRVELSDTNEPLMIYNSAEQQVFGTRFLGSDIELFFNGRIANDTINDALFLSADGVISMRDRLGLLPPSSPTGGTLSGTSNVLVGEKFLVTGSIFSGGKVLTLAVQGYGQAVRSSTVNGNGTNPECTIEFFVKTSPDDVDWTAGWVSKGGVITVIGQNSNVFIDGGGEFPDRWDITESINVNESIPVGTTNGLYYRARVVITHTLGPASVFTTINSELDSFIADEPVSAAVAAHNHEWGDVQNTPTTLAGYGITDASASGHDHSGVYEPVFSKNTAFNDNYGTGAGTVCEGNDSRVNNGQTAYGWGDHASGGYMPQTGGSMTGALDIRHTNVQLKLTDTTYSNKYWLLDHQNGDLTFRWNSTVNTAFILYENGDAKFGADAEATTFTENGVLLSAKYAPISHTHNASDINAGTLDIARIQLGTSAGTVSEGDHTHNYLNKPTDHTVNNVEYSITWENNGGTLFTSTADLKYNPANKRITTGEFQTLSGGDSVQWDTAYGWGDHASAGYSLTSHNHTGVYEPVFSKNTAFNDNYGTGALTVCVGNDSRLSDNRDPNAHNHSGADITTGTVLVARLPVGTSSSTVAAGDDARISNGQAAYNWGDHALGGYSLTSHAHGGIYEPVFSKNTAFNDNYGTGAGTVCEGNDSRLSDNRDPNAHDHGGLLHRDEFAGSVDLNTITLSGIYHQNSNAEAATGTNYPANLAGVLIVYSQPDGATVHVYQEYRIYNSSTVYRRNYYSSWQAWTRDVNTLDNNIGSGSGNYVAGNDSRLTDNRDPNAHNHSGADITTGTVLVARLPVGTSSSTVAAGDDARIANGQAAYNWGDHALGGYSSTGHNHAGIYEPVFSKNTAFNDNYGTGAGTVCQGNDSRLSDARAPTAHTHSGFGTFLASDTTSNLDTVGDSTGFVVKYSTASAVNEPSGVQDGAVMTNSYSAAWQTQMYSDWRTNKWYVRCQENTVWKPWETLATLESDQAWSGTNDFSEDAQFLSKVGLDATAQAYFENDGNNGINFYTGGFLAMTLDEFEDLHLVGDLYVGDTTISGSSPDLEFHDTSAEGGAGTDAADARGRITWYNYPDATAYPAGNPGVFDEELCAFGLLYSDQEALVIQHSTLGVNGLVCEEAFGDYEGGNGVYHVYFNAGNFLDGTDYVGDNGGSWNGNNTWTGISTFSNEIKSVKGYHVYDTRAAVVTPNLLQPKTFSSRFSNVEGVPSGSWASIMAVKGWDINYYSWELASSSSTSSDGKLYFRNGVNSTWNSWKTVALLETAQTWTATQLHSGTTGYFGVNSTTAGTTSHKAVMGASTAAGEAIFGVADDLGTAGADDYVRVGNNKLQYTSAQGTRNIALLESAQTWSGVQTHSEGLKRSAHNRGMLVGGYNNIGASPLKTSPIYVLGTSYYPNETTLNNMYGIGYTHTDSSFLNTATGTGWGMYVASDGDARIFLNAQTGVIAATDGVFTSARRYKNIERVETLDKSLEKVVAIGSKGVSIGRWKDPKKGKDLKRWLIAEDVNEVSPEVVAKNDEGECESIYSSQMIPDLYAAIAALNKTVTSLADTNAKLMERLEKLEGK